MTISDLLTLIGILLAILAFISERNREYIFLKFSNLEIGVLGLMFVFVHFLLSFQWWVERFPSLERSLIDGVPKSNAWAYIVSVLILAYCVWKIFFRPFPQSKKEQLLSYYKKLLVRKDFQFLAQLVQNYHLEQVIQYIKKKKTLKLEESTGVFWVDEENYREAYCNAIKGRDLQYGSRIYHEIILNDKFLNNVADLDPYLFPPVIRELDSLEPGQGNFVNRYLEILMKNKNSDFFSEIKNIDRLGDYGEYVIGEERSILHSLFDNANVCAINQAWRGVGDTARVEVLEESKKEFSALREPEIEKGANKTWSYRITIAISYFDIMVQQAIKQNIDDDMWMFYYRYFVSDLISNMQDLSSEESEINRQSRNFELIESIFVRMMGWKDVSIKSKNGLLSGSIYECIGKCLYQISITNKIRMEDKHYLINWVWEDLISSFGSDEESKEIVEGLIESGFKAFKQPTQFFASGSSYKTKEKDMYLDVLRELWNRRDTYALSGHKGKRAEVFKKEVIDKLFSV